ncbi:MAG: cyclic nucleotide-binding domain-containing protein [Actinomycetota bacterium]
MVRGELQALGGVPLFSGLSERHLRRVLRATEDYTYPDGATIVSEGRHSEQLFVILEGRARVIRSGRTVARMSSGDFFGEISLLDGGPRTATVVADGPVRCLVLLRKELTALLTETPQIAARALRALASRLRRLEGSPSA